jgi:Amt family ammonium transporter
MAAPAPSMDMSAMASYGDANVSALTGIVGDAPGTMVNDLNQSFVLTSAYLVFFMHCGFAMLSIGSVRSRFAKHISILILVDACMSALGFYLFGYAVAFGDKTTIMDDGTVMLTNNPFIGTQNVALANTTGDKYFFWVFEWAFAATACTIVSGAICERSRLEAYMLYSFFMAAWVYPVIVHSVWSPAGWASMFRNTAIAADLTVTSWKDNLTGYLFGSGVIDFAGSGAVHMVGGYGALAGSFVLGPRIGRYLPDGSVSFLTFSHVLSLG